MRGVSRRSKSAKICRLVRAALNEINTEGQIYRLIKAENITRDHFHRLFMDFACSTMDAGPRCSHFTTTIRVRLPVPLKRLGPQNDEEMKILPT